MSNPYHGYNTPPQKIHVSGCNFKFSLLCAGLLIIMGLIIWVGVAPHISPGLFLDDAPITVLQRAKTPSQTCTNFCNTCTQVSRKAGLYADKQTAGKDSQQCKETCNCCNKLETCLLEPGFPIICFGDFKTCKFSPPDFTPSIGNVLLCDPIGNFGILLSVDIAQECVSLGNYTGITEPGHGACCIGSNCMSDFLTFFECDDFGGTYKGDGTICANTTCS